MGKGALGLLAAYWPEDTPRYAHVPLKVSTEVVVHETAARVPQRPALSTAAGELTFAELSRRVRQVAAALRGRGERGARIAVLGDDPAELLVGALGAIEAERLVWMSSQAPAPDAIEAFRPELVIGEPLSGRPGVRLPDLLTEEESPGQGGRPDLRGPILALARADGRGEVVHNQKTLSATAIAVGSFYMLDADTRVLILEPPTSWLGLSLTLATWHKGGCVLAGWGEHAAPLPSAVDYAVCGWEAAGTRLLGGLGTRLRAGAIVGIENAFSLSRRRRIARALHAPVLTLFGGNDFGPVIGSHPSWFLDDALGIPLPNVDTRPLDPADGRPLSIGWDAVEEAELGVKSALAPAGGALIEGWLRGGVLAAIDPTGLYFVRGFLRSASARGPKGA